MITVVDLNLVPVLAPLISEVLFVKIQSTLAAGKKVLLSLNRRGAMSTLVCRDCGWAARCSRCDLSMRVHHSPRHFLLCHFCESEEHIPPACPRCHWHHLVQSGARIQTIEEGIRTLFPDEKILLIEKDVQQLSQKSLTDANLFIGTQKITSLPIDHLWLVAFVLIEADLSVPVYDIEEDVYGQVRSFLSRADEVVLQTRSPKLRLIHEMTSENFRTFFQRTAQERKSFHMPPFIEMVAIHVIDSSQSTLKSRVATLASAMIQAALDTSTTVTYDHLLIERRGGDYHQKILIKSPDIMRFLEPFRTTLVRSRGIEVEWL